MMGRRMGRPGLVGLAARTAVVAGTAGAVSNRQARRQQSRYEQESQSQAYEEQQQQAAMQAAAQQAAAAQQYAQQAPAAPAAAAPVDIVGQLERLAALQQQGILTPEEFAAEKAKLLNS
ncbi:SHOCT domain-containing protein [Mumia sp. Pv 4-285]|uniref:SHOCT domain-containing protein n=1 Tax=Mumia qirimensis TaxID=3234852 RepID=UPI00351CFA9A